MEVTVITSSGKSNDEISRIVQLFEHGLPVLHIRKPKLSRSEIEAFLKAIPSKYHDRVVIHGHYRLAVQYRLRGVHLQRSHRQPNWENRWKRFLLKLKHPTLRVSTTFRSLESLSENRWKFDYVFLGPIFTKQAHYHMDDASTVNSLRSQLANCGHKVYAIGGVDETKIPLLREVGFAGVGLSGSVWTQMQDVDFPALMHRFLAA